MRKENDLTGWLKDWGIGLDSDLTERARLRPVMKWFGS